MNAKLFTFYLKTKKVFLDKYIKLKYHCKIAFRGPASANDHIGLPTS